MKKIHCLSLALSLFLASQLAAQPSFLKIFNHPSAATSLAELPNGNIMVGEMGIRENISSNLLCLSPSGSPIWSVEYSAFYKTYLVDMVADGQGNTIAMILVREDISTFDLPLTIVLVKFDQNGQKIWDVALGKTSDQSLYYDMAGTPDGGFIVAYTLVFSGGGGGTACVKLGADNKVEWAKVFSTGGFQTYYSLKVLPDGNFLLGMSAGQSSGSSVSMLNPSGQVIWTKTYQNARIAGLDYFANGDLLLSGLWGATQISFVARTDAQGNLRWAKTMSLSDFGDRGAIVTPAGNIIANNYAINSLSRIIIQFTGDGELDWIRNIASNFSARGESICLSDGSFAIVGSKHVGFDYFTILAKTNSEGQVAGCETGLRCVQTTEIDLMLGPAVEVNSTPFQVDTTMEGVVTPIFVSSEDYCEPYQLPKPDFVIPDTVCLNDCINITGLDQAYAETWRWKLNGFWPSTSNEQDPSPVCAREVGDFTFTQVISFRDCLDTFSANINVQPVPQPNIGMDTVLCEAESLKLNATSLNTDHYVWNDQVEGPVRVVTESGKYAVTASNEYCSTSDEIEVVIFKAEFPDAELDLGPDQTLCDLLTYSLDSRIAGINEYTWNDGLKGSAREVNKSGYYELTASAFGCELVDGVEIIFEECDGKLYIPNSFSPNFDGINDKFEVLGVDFQPVQLLVFDRWGDLVFKSQPGNFAWDGQVRGVPGLLGVYTYMFSYIDKLEGPVKVTGGDVQLIR